MLASKFSATVRGWFYGCVVLLVAVGWSNPAVAAPSTSSPGESLLVRPDAINSPLLQQILPLEQMTRQSVEQLEARPVPAQVGTAEVGQVGQAAVACYFFEVLSKQLALRSEGAGVDFYLRATHWKDRLRKVVARWRQTPSFRTDELHRLIKAVHDAGLVQLPAIEARVQQGQLEGSEKILLGILAELFRYGIWIEESAGRYYMPFANLLAAQVTKPLDEMRRKRTADDLTLVLAQTPVNFDELPKRLADATVDIARVGLAPWGGESIAGPELVARIGQEWQRTQVRAQRLVAIELARRVGPGPTPPGVDQVHAAVTGMNEKLVKGLTDLVKVDTARVPPEAARALYEAYVRELARLAMAGDRAVLVAAWEPALAELAAKDTALKAEVDRYALCTGELLRWRRRVAATTVKHRTKNSPALDTALSRFGAKASNVPGVIHVNSGAFGSSLLDAAPFILTQWKEAALGREATAANVTGLGGGKSIARYQTRTYSRFTVPVSAALDGETKAFKSSLFVNSAQAPLTLDAALPIVSLQQGSYPYVGGSIAEIYLEPLLTRFMLLSDRSTGLLPLGPLPTENAVAQDLRSHVLVRIDLAPTWVAHECFVVDLER